MEIDLNEHLIVIWHISIDTLFLYKDVQIMCTKYNYIW
jgi:hypothetical protein